MSEKKKAHGEVAYKIVSDEKDFLEIEFERQDVGFANLLVEKLLKGKSVSFAAAAYDHPLKGNSVLRIRAKDPKRELHRAAGAVADELESFLKALDKTD
ncbi:MAG: RpoL/Rpb11 RNA polymerase subunit family protein [Candidatus Micrarchaeota archaeon]